MNSVDILVPDLPESVTDATVTMWYKKPGESVDCDEVLVEIETDKVILEVPAPVNGVVENILANQGTIVTSRQILCRLIKKSNDNIIKNDHLEAKDNYLIPEIVKGSSTEIQKNNSLSPTVRRLIAENDLNAKQIKGSGVGGRLTSEDIKSHVIEKNYKNQCNTFSSIKEKEIENSKEQRVIMTRLRKRIAERLLEVKSNTAMLTTFNEVNMKPIMDLRKKYGEIFEKKHDIRLGFMSFYVKAVVEALKRFPEINASIDGDCIVYHNYFDLSIAISTERGLITPVIKNVDNLSMAEIEKKIKLLAIKGREGKLTIEELTGGNFTITNGGIFGSLMSTPIINPPQSAILGMHAIKDRPVAVNGQVVILPMMYLALSYDHCLIDGRESVSYLVTVKEMLEDPIRLLLEV